MKKNFILFFATLICLGNIKAQSVYSNNFNNLTLQTFTSGTNVTQYTTAPSGFSLINDSHNNNASANNSPFNVTSLKTTGWAVVYNSIENDTFLVSTSWLDSSLTSNRWIITPPVSNIQANTVLTWLAKSPDASYPDGYEVYGTNKTGTLTAADFSVADKLLTITSENNGWTRRSVNLSAFAGQTLRFAFRNNSANMFQLWIDDIEVLTLSSNLDGQTAAIKTDKYILINTTHTVGATYTNKGAATINSVTLNYQYGTSSPVTQTFTFSNGLAYEQAAKVSFGLGYSFSSAGNYPLKAWATSPNGQADQNLSNDTIKINVTVQNTAPLKTVLVEQFVSTNNGESVDAQEKLKALESSSLIVVNVHDNDSLKETNSLGLLNAYKKQYASALIDRVYNDSLMSSAVTRPYYSNKIQNRLNSVTPASVTIINKTYNTGTRDLSFTVNADFIGEVIGDYRLNAYLIEKNVHGQTTDTSINGFNQLSNYYNVPWSPYFQEGYYSSANNAWVLNAYQFRHQNVLVHSFDGSFGSSGVIPQTGGTQGQSYQQTFTLTIPTSTNGVSKYNADNIYIVAFVAEYNTDNTKRDVLNAVQEKLTANGEVVSVKEISGPKQIVIYPNPASEQVFVMMDQKNDLVEILLYDMTGKVVKAQKHSDSSVAGLNIKDLQEGIYLLNIRTGNSVYNSKIIVHH